MPRIHPDAQAQMLRVLGTYFGVTMFDMASDGSQFTLVMPTRGIHQGRELRASEVEQ